MVVFLGAAIGFGSVLITCITLSAPQWAEAATNSTTHQSIPATPQCMRRVTVGSKPCGATIYIDGIEVGRTPMSFPMPLGRYTLVLFAPGHQPYGQRILVEDAPLEIDANLVPLP
jgi:PEGA domain